MLEALLRELREEHLHEVQPGTVLRREYTREAVGPGREIRLRLPRRVGRMGIQDHRDLEIAGVGGVQRLQELENLRTPMLRPHQPEAGGHNSWACSFGF